MTSKTLQSVMTALGNETVEEMDAMSEEELKQVILSANNAMEQVVEELELNAKYQEIKRQKSALEQGKKDVDKRQKARIKYSLYLLKEKGKEPQLDLYNVENEAL